MSFFFFLCPRMGWLDKWAFESGNERSGESGASFRWRSMVAERVNARCPWIGCCGQA